MNFVTLLLINVDVVTPSMGFDIHSQNNMEIISIPLAGSLKHKDTLGNDFVITQGEVQVMSAGTGIAHSEYNNSNRENVNFLQIWVIPKKMNIGPRYSQQQFDPSKRQGQWQLIVSPDGRAGSVEINQDAFFSMVDLKAGEGINYDKYLETNGVYLFVISGALNAGTQKLQARDGMGIENASRLELKALEETQLLLMEVPMYL